MRKTVSQLILTRPVPVPTTIHFKVSGIFKVNKEWMFFYLIKLISKFNIAANITMRKGILETCNLGFLIVDTL